MCKATGIVVVWSDWGLIKEIADELGSHLSFRVRKEICEKLSFCLSNRMLNYAKSHSVKGIQANKSS